MIQPAATIVEANALATSSTRAQLGGALGIAARTVFLRAKKTNSAEVYVGDGTVTSVGGGNVILDLQPGEGIFFDVNNTNLLWVVSAAAQTVYFAALK